ncbi:hexose phosphate transporter [Mesomycoplasma neurolyticum]|uniref:Mycoplasma MFS transporter n=1 Tax=Mesomycoplasma neurolyticum TaxID=2120 RepID=A0A449A4H5_9BACT|nr:hexose phosphate transporter [Mesomycoplasma neurolyticum]VEU59136.1 Mycoplasma MFS transporter [Mesomycoplasma neurolyticum]
MNFFKPTNIKEKPLTIAHGFILWGLLVFAYFLFVVNWTAASELIGRPGGKDGYGILGTFFPNASDAPSILTSQAVNWVITIGRGIGSILIGWLIVKVTHKYAVLISLGLMILSLPGIYIPNYWGYTIFRTFLGIGGTTMIVLIQPIISAFFPPRLKSSVSQFSPWFYPLGVIVVVAPFVGSNIEFEKKIANQWQTIFLVINLLALIPTIGFIIFGSRFDIYPSYLEKQKEAEKQLGKDKPSLIKFLKQKETWYWTLLYTSWLISVVIPYTSRKWIIYAIAGSKEAGEKVYGLYNSILSIFFLLFHAGMFIGSFSIGLWSRFRLKRKWFISLILSLGVSFYILSLIVFRTMVWNTDGSAKHTWLFYILGLLMGIMLWGIQGVMLNLPHEYPNSNPKIVGYRFGLIWGLGYFGLTILLIIMSRVASASPVAGVVLIVVFSVMSIGAIWLFKEPHPEYDTFPSKTTTQIKK